jgi:predicted Fe-S protein YdhL (DUF1289 family)
MATSPCIGVCTLDPATQVCVGCGRSIAEIAAWPSLSEAERKAILARLKQTPLGKGRDKTA